MEATLTNSVEQKVGGTGALLFVDSDPLLRWSVETHFRRWFSVDSAGDAREADALLKQRCFDAVIVSASLGRQMPRLEGAARSRNPNVRIVYLVTDGRGRNEDVPVLCLEKPFRLAALADALGVGSPSGGHR